jgi:CDP-diacylglycerol--serine O-phosphatidyltransferase
MRARRRSGHARIAPLQDAATAMRGVYLLPNLLTTAGLFCGVYAIAQTMVGAYPRAALAIIVAQFFDILDGRVARMTNTTSRFGVEYDSLCDLVSFGVAPGLLIYRWALMQFGPWGWLATALFICCAAVRLARYNTMVGTADPGFFAGLPVPASAAMLSSIVLMYKYLGRVGLPDKRVALLLMTYALGALMVSSIPYITGKQLRLHKRQPMWLFIVVILALNFLIAQYQLVIFVAATTYVASGPALWGWRMIRRRQTGTVAVADSDREEELSEDGTG